MANITLEDLNNSLDTFNKEFINNNLEMAYTIIPETLFKFNSPYINLKIGQNYYDCLIDTGATISVIPESIINKEKFNYLVDKRCIGEFKGVGTMKNIGRIHYLETEYNDFKIPLGFSVIEKNSPLNKIILGMDLIKSYQININFKKNQLEFENFNIPFQLI